MLSQILEWKYGPVADTAGNKITAWRHPILPQPDDIELEVVRKEYIAAQAAVAYKPKRAKEYWPLGEQLDAVYKAFKFMKAAGTDVGPDGDAWIAHVDSVKAKYPKP